MFPVQPPPRSASRPPSTIREAGSNPNGSGTPLHSSPVRLRKWRQPVPTTQWARVRIIELLKLGFATGRRPRPADDAASNGSTTLDRMAMRTRARPDWAAPVWSAAPPLVSSVRDARERSPWPRVPGRAAPAPCRADCAPGLPRWPRQFWSGVIGSSDHLQGRCEGHGSTGSCKRGFKSMRCGMGLVEVG